MPTLFRVESRELLPVSTRIISYGSSSKIARHATLYVLRVSRGGREWYVARRYSEFRVLYMALKDALARHHGRQTTTNKSNTSTGCAQCRELVSQYGTVQFPSRFPVRSGFASAKEKIESARMQQLNAFLQVLIETTQGLLANEDDDDSEDEDDDNEQDELADGEDRCDALRVIREFLMVHEHSNDNEKNQTQNQNQHHHANDPTIEETPATSSTPRSRQNGTTRPRLASGGSLVTSFRVHELDVMYRPTSPPSTWAPLDVVNTSIHINTSANTMGDDELDALFLADYASPAEDAVVHRQADTVENAKSTVQVLRRAETLRLSRRI